MIKISEGIEEKEVEVANCVCSCPGGICIPYIVPNATTQYVSIFESDERN
jgi:hypothetical protein